MIPSISILLPNYNHVCVSLVKTLQAQADCLANSLEYEIIVADDGSTNQEVVAKNRIINTLPHCQYIERGENVGRAAIRNFLAQEAQFPYLLFIDSDMTVKQSHYLAHYIKQSADIPIIYGGYKVDTSWNLQHNLRYIFEIKSQQNANCKMRQKQPYQNFHTSNFLVLQEIMLRFPFNECINTYGYEDVLWGKVLKENHINILHINNPVGFDIFEDNTEFLRKTEEGIRTLYQWRKELVGYSKLLTSANKLQQFHLDWFINRTYILFGKRIKASLKGNNPSIFLFNLYKLMYYIQLRHL